VIFNRNAIDADAQYLWTHLNCHWPCSEIKERIKKTKDEKKAKKAEVTKSQKAQTKGAVQKGSKGPKLGGGGGKRWKNCVIPDLAAAP